MSSTWYLAQLKAPEWEAKRKEVWKRDNYTCQKCRAQNCKVCAHHIRYPKGKPPWECPLSDLVTWCIECHNEFHRQTQVNARSLLDDETIRLLTEGGLHAEHWEAAVTA